MHAPLTGRSCVWWTYKIEERTRSGLFSATWRCTDSGTSDQRFLLADQDSHCLIDPDGAEVEPSERRKWAGNAFQEDQNCRYMEAILAEDTQLSVLGALRSDTGSITNHIDDEAAVLLTQWKQNQPALLARFDTNHDGHIDQAEWEAVRAAAVAQAQHDKLHQRPRARVSMLTKSDDGRPLVIAECSITQLTRLEKRRALAGLALTLLSLVAVCYSIAQLGH